MTSRPLLLDGLWHCLCPRFSTPSLRRPLITRLKRATSTLQAGVDSKRPPSTLSHSHHANARPTRDEGTPARSSYAEPIVERACLDHSENTSKKRLNHATSYDYIRENPSWTVSGSTVDIESFARDSPLRAYLNNGNLSRIETAELYVLLRTCANRGLRKEVDYIAKILILDRKEKPNLKLYGSLIASNIDPATGSAEEAAMLLNELSGHELIADTGIYHHILRVLAVHPNAILRGQVVQEMRSLWLSMTAGGQHDLIAGQVKEGEIELALESLWDMQRAQVRVEAWLYEMMIYKLCDMGEVEEASSLLKYMVSNGVNNMSSSVWYFVFGRACELLHYGAIQFIWNRRVELNHLTPSVPQCTHALMAAARNGDAQLASDVFRVLTRRSALLQSQHYEALMQAYIGVHDLETALTVLCIMSRSGVQPSERSTWPIYLYVRPKIDRVHKMLGILQALHKSGRDIPVVAVNCLLDASTGRLQLEEIVEQYKMLHRLCSRGPNIDTFNILFRACRIARQKDTAMFLASEMIHLGIKPVALTYDRLMLVCLKDKFLKDAYRYYQEMGAAGMKARKGTFANLIEALGEAGDDRVWDVLEDMRKAHPDYAGQMAAWLRKNWRNEPEDGTFIQNAQAVSKVI